MTQRMKGGTAIINGAGINVSPVFRASPIQKLTLMCTGKVQLRLLGTAITFSEVGSSVALNSQQLHSTQQQDSPRVQQKQNSSSQQLKRKAASQA
ncbi:MAG: hypothetical protein F6J89_08795 [Symploca sp. SIO1C4]|uniref:Uncharacterized protein n=1 Tax=Symploca sp. SIO1C4 TaxID=2607765 RepID=A0A6B3NA07_9CYAN|nr:hypothetical protein [Symploca sp. SIO1C4]